MYCQIILLWIYTKLSYTPVSLNEIMMVALLPLLTAHGKASHSGVVKTLIAVTSRSILSLLPACGNYELNT